MNSEAWKVKAFVNLVKAGRIETDGMSYYMDGRRMDGSTLYDAFISVRTRLTREEAMQNVPSPRFSAMHVRGRIPQDAGNLGTCGFYESMYEIKRIEFYQLFLACFG